MKVTASSDCSWFCYYFEKNGIYIYCSDSNNSYRRSGTITLRCGSQTTQITVKQNGFVKCSNPNCQGGYVWGGYFGWMPCMVCGTHGGFESNW